MARKISPEQRALLARAAAHSLHAQVDSTEHTAPARRAFLARFEQQVDPDGALDPAERKRRAEHAKKAHFSRLAAKSVASRQAKNDTSRGALTHPGSVKTSRGVSTPAARAS